MQVGRRVSGYDCEYGKLLLNREFGKAGALKLIDFVQARNLRNLELSTSVEVQTNARSPTNCLAIEKIEYRYLLSGALNGSISLYDLEVASSGYGTKHTLQPIHEHTPGINSNHGSFGSGSGMVATLQWYPEDSGAFISAGMTGHVSIFDTNYFAIVADFALEQVLYCARMRSSVTESALIAAALQDGTVRMCDPRTRDTSHIIRAHDRAATCIDWCTGVGSEYLLASAGMDGAVRFWDVRRAGSMNDAVVRCLDWRGDFTASAKIDTRKLHTSLTDQRFSSTSNTGVHIRDATQHYRFNPSESDSTVSSVRAGRAHDGGVMSLRYTSCGNFVITSGNDQRLRLWHAHTGKLMQVTYPDNVVPVAQLPYDISVAEMSFASADSLLVPASGNCSVPSCLSELGGADGEVRTNEGDILLIPAHSEDGQPTRLLRGHLQRVTALAYRKPQQQVISAARDGLIFLWAPTRPKEIASASGESRSKAEERERNKQHRLYYGSSGARYDFAQVLENVGQPNANNPNGSASNGSNNRDITTSGRPLLRRPVLLPKCLPEDDSSAEQAQSSREAVGSSMEDNSFLSTGQRATFSTSLSSEEDSGSGDDWTDEEVETSAGPSLGTTLSAVSAVKRARTSAASIVSAAGAAMNAAENNINNNAGYSVAGASQSPQTTAINNTSGGSSSSSSSRSFVPPIIQQYMADASREARSSSQVTNAATSSSTSRVTATATPMAAPTTIVPAPDWENIDQIFDATTTSAASSVMPGDHNVPSIAPSRAASGGTGTAAKNNSTLTADQRYAQWLKQSRSKATKKK